MVSSRDLIVIAFYLALLAGIGIAFRRANRNADDYYRSGCKGTWWLVGVGAFIGTTGPGTFVAAAGMHYEAGFTAYSYGALALLSWLLLIIPAAWFRQTRCITLPEMVNKRFGSGLQQFYAGMNVLLGVLGSAVQLWALAVFCATIFGLDVRVTILSLGLVITFYSTVGGVWAVLGTSFIQGLIILPVAFLVAGLSWFEVGGLSGFLQKMAATPGLDVDWAVIKQPGVFTDDMYGAGWLAAMALLLIPQAFSMGSASRFFTVKDGADARKAQILAVLLYVPTLLLWCIPSWVARLLYSDQVMATHLSKPVESAFAVASLNVLPRQLTVLIAIALFASGAGTLCAMLNQNAAMLTQDIFPFLRSKLRRGIIGAAADSSGRIGGTPRPASTGSLVMAKACTALSGAALVLISLWFASRDALGVFEAILQITALLWLPMTAPMFLGILVRRTPASAAPISIACGFCVSLWAFVNGWNFVWTVTGVWIASHGSFLATMPFYARSSAAYREKVDRFFRTMHTPVDFESEVGQEQDLAQLRTLGRFTALTGALLMLLLLVVSDAKGALCVVGVSGAVLLMGAIMLLAAGRADRTQSGVVVSGMGLRNEGGDVIAGVSRADSVLTGNEG